MIDRLLEKSISENLYKGKAIIIIGPRQVGKTTLVNQIKEKLNKKTIFFNCDEFETKSLLTEPSLNQLRDLISDHEIVIIDEAQRIRNIGLTLKLIIDNIKEIQIIVTGSSALELSNSINEPLTGRKFEYHLYPLSINELKGTFGMFEESKVLYKRLVYGMYPDVINFPGQEREILNNLAASYLYKDVFAYQEIRRPELLDHLLKALALQISGEVSYYEIAQLLGSDPNTIKRYLELLEKAYVIFKLSSYNRNIRTELKKSQKIYFYDNGIRNAILGNFNGIDSREDLGQLWENYMVSERVKHLHYTKTYAHQYFWRTQQQQEIDYLEEYDGKLYAFEFKWNPRMKVNFSKTFLKNYKVESTKIINNENYWEFFK